MKTKKAAKKSGPSKAEFVRAQPSTMSAKDVVDKAKADGLVITDSYVYKLRSVKKAKATSKGAPKAAKAAKAPRASKAAKAPRAPKVAGKRRGRKPGSAGTKTAFVLSLPFDLPAAEVVKKAEAQGFKIGDKYVYSIRSAKRNKVPKGAPRKVGRPVGRPPKHLSSSTRAVASGVRHDSGIEQQFVRMAVALGTARAGELLRKLDQKLSSLSL